MSDRTVNRLGLVLAAALTACVCPPTVHQEQTYASSIMADQINLCATEGNCTILCSRAFALEPGMIDSCRILSLDHNGGAYVEVTWSEYVCTFEDWDDDGGDDWTYEEDEYDPCWDGSCDPTGGDDDYPDELPGDDEYPDDEYPDDEYDDEPPPDDDWMDEGPP